MRVLITGICGFAGSVIAETLTQLDGGVRVTGIDNFKRPGSEINRNRLKRFGVEVLHGDLRIASDFEALPRVDWVIDAAAEPSVLAGISGPGTSRQLFENNLGGLINVLEHCRSCSAGLILLSTSRVFSIKALTSLPLKVTNDAFDLDTEEDLPAGLSEYGIAVDFSTAAPISLYGSTKLASEVFALEYGETFGFPVWIDRCGVLAGGGQFGNPEQGIFSYWINAHLRKRPLRYIGFQGTGHQVRDVFHPRDLSVLLLRQMNSGRNEGRRVYTVGGGQASRMSLRQLNEWCNDRFERHEPSVDERIRPFDIPWVLMDSRCAMADFGWKPEVPLKEILVEIANHATANPDWLELSAQ